MVAIRAAIRTDGAIENRPAPHLPPARDDNEARRFAEQNARIPQLESRPEFFASVLRRDTTDTGV